MNGKDIQEILQAVNENKEWLGGAAAVAGGAFWVMRKLFKGKKKTHSKPSVQQTTHGDSSPAVVTKGEVKIISGSHNPSMQAQHDIAVHNHYNISLDDYNEVYKDKITAELKLEQKETAFQQLQKDKELTEEQLKDAKEKLEETLSKQNIDEQLKEKITTLIDEKKYDEAEPLLYYLLLKDKDNAAFNFQYANLKQLQIKYSDALTYYRKAARLQPENTLYLNDLGYQYNVLGEPRKAIEYYEKALQIDLKNFGETHPKIAVYNNNLGTAWNDLGEPRKAIEYYEKALQIDLRNLGETHPKIAIRYNNLGAAWNDLGEPRKAIEYVEKALQIDLKNFGETHPDTAIDYNNLGAAWDNLKDESKAEAYYQKALKIRMEKLGAEHPHTKITRQNLALLQNKMKQGY